MLKHAMRITMSLAMVALATTACTRGGGTDGAVATVNGKAVSKVEFDQQLSRTLARYQGAGRAVSPALEARLKKSILNKLIDDEIIRQKAESLSLTVAEEEAKTKLEEHKRRFGSDQRFQEYLTKTKNTEDQVKSDLVQNLLRDRVIKKLAEDAPITDEEMKAYYDKNKERYTKKEQIKASHILVKVEEKADAAAKKKAREKIDQALKAVKGGMDFAEAAKKFSEGPTAPRGGDLGFFPRGRMVPDFEEVAFKLKPGDLSDVVETRFGYHVIKVFEKKEPSEETFEDVKDRIRSTLEARARSKARRGALETLRKDAKIERLIQIDVPAMEGPGGKPAGMEGEEGEGGRPGAMMRPGVLPQGMLQPGGPAKVNPMGAGPETDAAAPGAPAADEAGNEGAE